VADQALEAAKAADRKVAGGGGLPRLHGVPFTVKENIDLAGAPTTHGLKVLAGAYPGRDAPAVERLKTAGAIPVGHTNCPTLAVRWHTDSELWGVTINPWDRSRTPGASSGGEAAALATGMTPLGLGNDGLGSLRWPAQCCGISVLKPTLGRIPAASTIEPVDAPIGIQLTAVQGPMARRVADLRAAFEVLAGPTWRDPWTVPAPLRAWGEFQEAHPLNMAPIYTGIPFEAGADLADGAVAETIAGMRMAIAVNALGLPAVALPAGIADGLPQAVQVIGPRYREDLCLDAAAALEDRLGIITPIDPR
jgi:Asp-tRNA(Asn)/Glu-tRNA(Gln) amidotransferase A subunit family amidase